MKSKGRHGHNALTQTKINALKQAGRYADGYGLYLVVAPSGSKRWVLRTTVKGRRCDLGLGGLANVSLAEARRKAEELRKIAKTGGDPLTQKRNQKAIPTFAEAIPIVHAEQKGSWKNGKHSVQWINTLQTYAVPHLGTLRVDQIDTPDVLRTLSPIWLTKQETARRVRQRIGVVLDWAKASGYRTAENPVAGVTKGLPKQTKKQNHHAALPFSDAPGFLKRLQESKNNPCTKLAFEFLLLTATRTDELLKMQWSEVENDIWTIPAERTKPNREFRVPLVPRCMKILEEAKKYSDGKSYVFPGQNVGKPLSNMVFLMALRRMKLGYKLSAHGFRSTITDWAHEKTSYPHIVIEMVLNHSIKDKTEAAYRRTDLFDKRRELMLAWANFLVSETTT